MEVEGVTAPVVAFRVRPVVDVKVPPLVPVMVGATAVAVVRQNEAPA